MGFVKTPEEVARIEKVASHPRFVGSEMLTIDFLTTPEFVASVLPPGLEPATEPLVTAMVGRWRSNCVGDYAGGAIYLMARHKTIEAPMCSPCTWTPTTRSCSAAISLASQRSARPATCAGTGSPSTD